MRKLISLLLSLLPVVTKAKSVQGIASYYSDQYDGRVMANGEKFHQYLPIVATHDFPLGTKVRIEYVSRMGQRRVAHGVVSDRGPAGWVRAENPERRFDLSWSLFKRLETPRVGLIRVTVTEVK